MENFLIRAQNIKDPHLEFLSHIIRKFLQKLPYKYTLEIEMHKAFFRELGRLWRSNWTHISLKVHLI